MELTAEQMAAVESDSRRVVLYGGAGTGKTSALMARHRRLAQAAPSSRILVVCRHRAAAQRFVAAVLPHLRGGFDALPVTTVHGLAYDLVRRSGEEVSLLGGAEQRAFVRRLLTSEDPADWPSLGHFLGQPAFADEVTRALGVIREAGTQAALAAGGRWAEVAGFGLRYEAAVAAAGLADTSGLMAAAVEAAGAGAHRDRFDHLIVDDADALPESGVRLLEALVAAGGPALTAAEDPGWGRAFTGTGSTDVPLSRCFRAVPPGRLIACSHPSVEAEAVAGELLAANRRGVAWSGMAVVARTLGRRARSIGRALARHGIPVVPTPALAPEEPVVQAVVDLLRWVAGEDLPERLLVSPLARLHPAEVRALRHSTLGAGVPLEADPRVAPLISLRDRLRARLAAGDTPADLAYEAWAAALPQVGATGLGAVDDRALDALVAFVDGLSGFGERRPGAGLAETLAAFDEGELLPDAWRSAATAGDGVTITSINGAAGFEWHTVVVTGAVEGELPRLGSRAALFDPAALASSPVPSPLVEERRLFALATSRATTTLVATAGPEPGVLLSRFVEDWRAEPPDLPMAPGRRAPHRAATAGTVPVWPDGELRLSASQLDTYDDCPLRYSYQYVLRARDEPGVHAGLGSLVHKVLEVFLDPASPEPPPRSLDGLLAVADGLWDDGIARYRPQAEQARRDLLAMLTLWWKHEGATAPEVLAVERRFDIAVDRHRLTGSIDRVDRADDGVGVRVVDYKTGKREPAPGDVADDLQLAIYHLAATSDPHLAALGPPTQLQLRYLRTMRTYHQPVAEDHAARTTARVLAAADLILAEKFEPSVDANCRICPFHRLCPIQDAGRQVRPE